MPQEWEGLKVRLGKLTPALLTGEMWAAGFPADRRTVLSNQRPLLHSLADLKPFPPDFYRHSMSK